MKKNGWTKLPFLVLLIAFTTNISAQSLYQKGWDSFLNNKREEARGYFQKASKDNKFKSEAYLSLALLDNAEDRVDEAFENWAKFYEGSEKSNVFLYTTSHMQFAFSTRNALKQNKLDFVQQLEKTPSLNGYLKSIVSTTLGYHYAGINELDKANEYFKSTGVLYDWQILGQFDNTSGGGFDKDWGALKKTKNNDKFLNTVGAEVSWFNPGRNKMDGWFHFDYYMQPSNSILYAQSFVNITEDREVILSIGVSGSLKAWLNDALMLSVDEERNCGMDLYATKVKLNKGANRLLLQLGASEITSSNFYVRFVDEVGNPVTGITSSHEFAEYKKDNSVKIPEMIDFYPEKMLKEMIAKDADNMLYSILLAEQYLIADKSDEATELLLSLQKKYPTSSLLHQKLSESYTRAKNQTYATREIEAIMLNDPDSYYAQVLQISVAQQSNKTNEVKELLEKLIKQYGRSEYAIGIEQWIAGRENDTQKRVSLAEERYKKHPENYSMASSLYYITDNSLKDSKAAKKIIEDYYNTYYNDNAVQTLSSIYMKEGDTEKALSLLEDRLKRLPFASGYYLNYAQTLLNMQRYDKALEVSDNLLRLTPYEASTYNLIANIYKAKGDNEKAISNYKKAIYYYPGHFNALDQLRLLKASNEMEFYFPKNNLDSLIAKAGSAADFPDDNSIIVLLTEDILLHEGGAHESHIEIAVKILNQSGIDSWKEYVISAFSGQNITIDKAEIIKANGQKVRAENNRGHIVFTGLEIGDVLHLDYRMKTYYSGKLSKVFTGNSIFQYALPTMQVRYMMATPHDYKFDYKFVNGDLKPLISKLSDKTLYKWELNNQSSVKVEPLMPSIEDIAPTLFVSNVPDWKYVREWYEDLTSNKFKSDYLLRTTVAELMKGKESISDLEKAKIFYEYIVKNISYLNVAFMQDNYIPQKASRTLSTRMGDCKDVSTLFTAMCREVGIDANLVLVLTRDYGKNATILPAISFNHAIAELHVDGKRYLLELTSSQLPFGTAFETVLDATMLSIKNPKDGKTDALELIDMSAQTPNNVIRNAKVEFDNNNYNVDFASANYGNRGAYLRYSFADIGQEERTKSMNESVASDYRARTTVSDLEFTNLDNLKEQVEYTYKLVVENMIQDIAGMKVFKLVWTDNLGTLEEISIQDRKYPFMNWAYKSGDASKEIITVIIPEGKSLIEVPSDINLECAIAKYSLRFDTSQAGILKVTREFTPKAGIVSVEQYPEFSKFLRDVSTNDEKQYVIK
ncbi:DUF3857 domain-containing protein [Dysgonomonas massiliensis]|uniref:DUF3857 domain-containing protein n=1 Tax=Dysgonomonas massiliensis TaxID=2040292 RepID=UPI000C78F353|nr:DUF3857 domain-containing protein [Dysgonomonas massiliensis]